MKGTILMNVPKCSSDQPKNRISAIVDATAMNPVRKLRLRRPNKNEIAFKSEEELETYLTTGLYGIHYTTDSNEFAWLKFEIMENWELKVPEDQKGCIVIERSRQETLIKLKIIGFVYQFDPSILIDHDTKWRGNNHRKLYFAFYGATFGNDVEFPQDVNVFPGNHAVGYCTGLRTYCKAKYKILDNGRLVVIPSYNKFMAVEELPKKKSKTPARQRLNIHGVKIKFNGTAIAVKKMYIWSCLHGFENDSTRAVRLLPGKHFVCYVSVLDQYALDTFELSIDGTLEPTNYPSLFIRARNRMVFAVGAPITIDARNLTKKTVSIVGERSDRGLVTTRVLPGKYRIEVGGKSFLLEVTTKGKVKYDPEYDKKIEGKGTATITVWEPLD
jgi:hypothetical protein